MLNVFDLLKERGYLEKTTSDAGLRRALGGRTTVYVGFDPTADSLTAGHLIPLLVFRYLQEAGHRVIFLSGGGTSFIGDPSGRETTRPLLSPAQIKGNLSTIKKQIRRFLNFKGKNTALLLDNADWLLDLTLIKDYAREIAKNFSVAELLSRETFKNRLQKNLPLSLLELLYPTLQAYDFLYLFDHFSCRVQFGGSDQWGNLLSGVDLIRRRRGVEVFAFTTPLLTTSTGAKMGKTAGGKTIWLNNNKTSPFEFYQYFRNTADVDLENYLKFLTLLSLGEIEDLLKKHPREIQRILAFEVTKIVHGEKKALASQKDAEAITIGRDAATLSLPTIQISSTELSQKIKLSEVLVRAKILPSKSAFRRLTEQSGLKLNGVPLSDPNYRLQSSDFKDDAMLIRLGQKRAIEIALKT